MSNINLEARGLKRHYERGSETVKALDGVDISILEGEIASIPGPSGSGKTTLINQLSCQDAPTEGTLLVADEPTGNLDKATGQSIIDLFKHLAREEGLAILLTTHNTVFAAEADRVITLEDGRIVSEVNRKQPRFDSGEH